MALTPAMEPLSKLNRMPRNPKAHDLGDIHTSYNRFGFAQRIVINDETGRIVAGHGRVDTLQQRKAMGLKRPENIGIDEETGEWLVPADHISIPEHEEEALAVALNRIGEGLWNRELQAQVLSDLAASGPDGLYGTGFDTDDLDQLLRDLHKDQAPPPGGEGREGEDAKGEPEDVIARLRDKWGTQPGQIWQMGLHRLVIGDATDPAVVDALLGGQKAAMVWTDPPYNVDYGKSKHHPSWHIRSIKGDSQPVDVWQVFCREFGSRIKENCTGDVYVWGAPGPMGMRMRLILVELGLHWSATIIWKKSHLVLSPAKYQRMYEPCLYGWFGKKSSFAADRTETEVWEVDRPIRSPWHPTQKPIELAARALVNSSRRGDLVADFFLGSGTFFLACEKTGRIGRGIELDPGNAAVVLHRMLRTKGLSPTLIGHIEGVSEESENESAEAIPT